MGDNYYTFKWGLIRPEMPLGLDVNSEDQAEDVVVILVVEHNQPAGRESLAWYREVICCHQHQLT